MFAAVQRALANGHAICLFPEGISHVSGHLEQLRNGAARMALTSAAAGHPVTIIPVGLNFDRLPMFRSRVVAMFGRPFDGADLVQGFRQDPKDATRSEEHTSELQSQAHHVCRLLLEKKKPQNPLTVLARFAAATG